MRRGARTLVRFDHAMALLGCALLPFLMANFGVKIGKLDPQSAHTATAIAIAIVLGGWLAGRLSALPGIQRSAGILPSYAIAFGVVLLAILVLRIPYTRWIMLYGFGSTLLWYYLVALYRNEPLVLGLVRGGWADRFAGLGSVRTTDIALDREPGTVHAVVVDMRRDHSDAWEARMADFALAGIPVYNAKDLYESLTGRADLEHLSENNLGGLGPLVAFQQFKALIDRLTALIALVPLLPVFAIAALAIKLDSPGPVIFRQTRMGFRGRPFRVFKFRTMHAQADAPPDIRAHLMTLEGDARITRVGRFLRRTRIDELPQVFNILRGEMSWIGPRPEAVGLSKWYESELPFYRYRHVVYPGITGWAQVNQGHVTDLDDIRTKLQYDFYYIRNFSVWLDLVIIARTAVAVLTGFGHR